MVVILGLSSCSKTPQERMISELEKRAKIYQKENIEYIKFEILTIDTLEVGGLFYDATVRARAKHKAFTKENIDITKVLFSDEFVIID